MFSSIKDRSKLELCATKGKSSMNVINFGKASSMDIASRTKSSSIPVIAVITSGIGHLGFINTLNSSINSLFLYFKAPISII